MSNEQWKQGGECSKCRRQKYCKKECSEHKRMIDRVVRMGVAKYFGDHLVKGPYKL